MPLPTHSVLGGNLLGLPSPWISVGFKSTQNRKAGSLFQWTPPAPFVFPFLTFNKPHLYPRFLLGFFQAVIQGPRSSENTILPSTLSLIEEKFPYNPLLSDLDASNSH
jgi:hypothetical protein